MARILYGVAGEGYGHCTRADLIGQRLLDAGNELRFVCFGKALSYLLPRFGDRVRHVSGMGFRYTKGRIDRWRTFWGNLFCLGVIARENMVVLRELAARFGPELVLTDFEPFSVWWAWRNGIPVISIDNEHLLTHCVIEGMPPGRFDRIVARTITSLYSFKASIYVVLSFFPARTRGPDVLLSPPVVRPAVQDLNPTDGGYVLLYLSTGQQRSDCLEVLDGFRQTRFIVYGFDEDARFGNLVLKRWSVEGFLRDLAACSGVVSSAGFSLISECIALRKPMLLLPVPGQYEQLVNAVFVERLGLGIWSKRLARSSLGHFLDFMARPRVVDPQVIGPDNRRFFALLGQAAERVGVTIGL